MSLDVKKKFNWILKKTGDFLNYENITYYTESTFSLSAKQAEVDGITKK